MKLCGDVEENLGPKPGSNQVFSICHWNFNSISVHNYTKLSLLRAYLSTHWFDVICLSETYLDSETSHEDASLEIVSYTVIRANNPSNTKRSLLSLLQKLAGKEINKIGEGFIRAVCESKISSVKDF